MYEPYEYTDAHNHRITIRPAPSNTGHTYVAVEADDLAIGGTHVSTWIPAAVAQQLTAALAEGAPFEHSDHTGDALAVAMADDWTTFTLTRCPEDEDDDAQGDTVRVVALTARMAEIRAAITAAAVEAQRQAAAVEDEHPADHEKPQPHPERPASLDALLDHVAANLPDEQPTADEEQAQQPRRILTDDEWNATYRAAQRAGRHGPLSDVLAATLATVGILTPAPEAEPDTCPAMFADPDGDWWQCQQDTGHDPADGHDAGDWSWSDAETAAEAQQ